MFFLGCSDLSGLRIGMRLLKHSQYNCGCLDISKESVREETEVSADGEDEELLGNDCSIISGRRIMGKKIYCKNI